MRVVSYYKDQKPNNLSDTDLELCRDAILLAQEESTTDRLSDNYSYNRLHLDRMVLFNIVFDNDKPVLMSGSQLINNNTVRVFSRYYHFNNYRTNGTVLLDKVDDFLELKYSLEYLNNFKLIIWTRDKSKGFFTKLKKGRPDVFADWIVHPTKEQIMYPDNHQYVFYTGDIKFLIQPTM